jgi:hypothetical protein
MVQGEHGNADVRTGDIAGECDILKGCRRPRSALEVNGAATRASRVAGEPANCHRMAALCYLLTGGLDASCLPGNPSSTPM